MITLLSALIGFLTAGFPSLLQIFQDKQDKRHELDVLNMQVELAKLNIDSKLKEVQLLGNAEELKEIYSNYRSGINWVDALNGTVRPVVAYILIFAYCMMEYSIFHTFSHSNEPLGVLLDHIWTDEDQALFACIISFYFGNRTFKMND